MMNRLNRVLAVDDEPINLELIEGILAPEGYEVVLAGSGEGALASVAEKQPDVILLDVMMPRLDGFEVARRLKAEEATRDIPIIFVTGRTDVEDEARGFELGAVDYVTKPIGAAILKARVKTHVELRNAYQNLKRQNEVLRENVRLREEVERITRHDLKTPLTAVLNVPELLIQDGNLNSGQVELLQMLEESGYRMLEIVNSSLDLYKMEQGTYQPRSVPVNILPVLNQIRGETRELMTAKGLSVRVLIHGEPVRDSDVFLVNGEEMLLYSMLANLIKNSVEASPEGNQITVSLTKGDSTVISVHNMGAVPEDIRQSFFDKYATSGKAGGTGLGTYSARLIAETLGGRIDLDSSQNMGTTVTVLFPRRTEEPHPPTVAPRAERRAPGMPRDLKVLVADDYATMRRAIKGMLRQMGFSDFLDAEDGQQALKLIESQDVDLIISDLNMPRLNGLELLRHVRASDEHRGIPFLMVTAEADREAVFEAARAQVSGYLIKPFTSDLLEKKIEAVLS
jgi:CheY-like chemotaxis protein